MRSKTVFTKLKLTLKKDKEMNVIKSVFKASKTDGI